MYFFFKKTKQALPLKKTSIIMKAEIIGEINIFAYILWCMYTIGDGSKKMLLVLKGALEEVFLLIN